MFKQIVAIILLSVVVILAMQQAQYVIELLISAHAWVADTLTKVFSGDTAGDMARQLITLLSVPVVIGLIPTLVYWVTKRSWFPYFMDVVWIVWLIQTSALIISTKAAA